jgi:hypothetical protein
MKQIFLLLVLSLSIRCTKTYTETEQCILLQQCRIVGDSVGYFGEDLAFTLDHNYDFIKKMTWSKSGNEISSDHRTCKLPSLNDYHNGTYEMNIYTDNSNCPSVTLQHHVKGKVKSFNSIPCTIDSNSIISNNAKQFVKDKLGFFDSSKNIYEGQVSFGLYTIDFSLLGRPYSGAFRVRQYGETPTYQDAAVVMNYRFSGSPYYPKGLNLVLFITEKSNGYEFAFCEIKLMEYWNSQPDEQTVSCRVLLPK